MKIIRKYLEGVEAVLVYAYIWQIPFSWRFILDPNRSQRSAGFNEYMDISLYIGEILLIIALLIHILRYNIEKKSIYKNRFKVLISKLFHVEHRKKIFFIGIITLVLLNVFFSIDCPLTLMSIFHWINFAFFVLLIKGLYVSRGTIIISSIFFILSISVFLQTFVSLNQVIYGSSIGFKMLNESILSLHEINIAKSNIFSHLILRGYGTFPHPNILAAYAAFTIIYGILFKKIMFHVEHLYPVTLFFSTFLIILTQSKLTFIFITIMYLYLVLKNYKRRKLFHVEHLYLLVITVLFLIFFSFLFKQDIYNSFKTRVDQYRIQLSHLNVTLFGSGLGTYRLSYDTQSADWWNMEPIHFTPIIALSEIGIALLLFGSYVLYKYIKIVPRGTWIGISLPMFFLVFILVFDHYAWDIYQGNFLLLSISLLIAYRVIIDIDYKKCYSIDNFNNRD